MKSLIFIFMASLFLASCGHFHDEPNVSVWAGQLWLAFWIPFLGSLWFFYLSYRASKSNSTRQDKVKGIIDNTGNVPIYKVGKFWLAVVLFLFSWGLVIYVNSNWWK